VAFCCVANEQERDSCVLALMAVIDSRLFSGKADFVITGLSGRVVGCICWYSSLSLSTSFFLFGKFQFLLQNIINFR